MNVSIGKRWERFVEEAVEPGRYGSASELIREGLPGRRARSDACGPAPDLAWIEAGGDNSDADIAADVALIVEEAKRQGM